MDRFDRAGFESITRELEALKRRLAEMDATAISATEAGAMKDEIGAIRLHLKRLGADRRAVANEIARSLGLKPAP